MLMRIKNTVIAILFSFHFCIGFAQNKSFVTINWKPDISEPSTNLQLIEKPYFEKAFYPTPSSYPYYVISEIVTGKVEKANILIENKNTSTVNKVYSQLQTTESKPIKMDLKYIGKNTLIQFYIPTFEKDASNKKKLLSFEYSFSYKPPMYEIN